MGYLKGAYIDKGYSIRRISMPKETICRKVALTYHELPSDKSTLKVAGVR